MKTQYLHISTMQKILTRRLVGLTDEFPLHGNCVSAYCWRDYVCF